MPQARKTKKEPAPPSIVSRRLREGGLLLLGAAAIFLLAALLSYAPQDPAWSHLGQTNGIRNWGGRVGAWLADVSFYLLGFCAFVLPLLVVYAGWRAFRERDGGLGLHGPMYLVLRAGGFLLTLLAGAALARRYLEAFATHLPATSGGVVGDLLSEAAAARFGAGGASLLLLAVFLAGITLFTGVSWLAVIDGVGRIVLGMVSTVAAGLGRFRERRQSDQLKKTREKAVKQEVIRVKKRKPTKIEPVVEMQEPPSPRVQREKQRTLFKDVAPGELPPLSLLDPPPSSHGGYAEAALDAMARQVELKLRDFGIEVEVVAVHQGPVITRFELQPAPGVKASRITNLAKDLARALSTVSVRVVEVIPGKSVVGLEIPNEQRDLIALSEVLNARAYDAAKSPLTMALGKSISGKPVVADLGKMPHLLVAGTTGSGKSVAVNAMILSLLYKASADEVRLILVDPKMLELSVYEGIPHLLTPVVTDMADASNALRWCVGEMEHRYKLMSAMGVRNMAGFNKKVAEAKKAGQPLTDPLFKPPPPLTLDDDTPPPPAPELERMPYIVVVIDELADMMMIVGKKVEQLIARLAQKARAAGIHLILATQRPSVDVITGLIKANIPTRIAFQVSAKVDSRTILDQMGAEALLGQGDMLFMPPGTSIPERVHGAFVDDHEVHNVVSFLQQQGEPSYIEEITSESAEPVLPAEFAQAQADSQRGSAESDPLYDQAVRIVTETRKASISGVQRRLQIGYNRAARMIEEMESAGIVSAPQNNGSREVIAPPPPKD